MLTRFENAGADRHGRALRLSLVLLLAGGLLAGCASERTVPPPPETEVEPVKETLHDEEIVDPYRWLEDDEAPATREWIDQQNAYTDALLARFPGRERIRDKIEELAKVDVVGMPVERGGRYFYSKRLADEDQPSIYMREGLEGVEQKLIDPASLSDDMSKAVGIADVSDDGRLLAYEIRSGGRDEVELHFLDVESGEELADVFPAARYWGLSLTPDADGAYYTRFDEQGPRVLFHRFGDDFDQDRLVFGEGYSKDYIIWAIPDDDARYLVIHVQRGSSGSNEVFFANLRGDQPPRKISPDVEAKFTGVIEGDRLFIQTDWQAPNGRMLAVSPRQPDFQNWTEIVPERPEAVLQSFSGVGGRLYVSYLEDVKSRVVAFAPDGSETGEIRFDTIGTVTGVRGQWDREEAFFAFTSFHVPTTIYRYDTATDERSVWHKPDIPVDPDDYTVQQVWATSADGTEVPMFLVHRKGLEPNGKTPTLLTGYGGFRVSRVPRFSGTAAAWLDEGGLYVVANLRGGGEFGETWHRAGMLEQKQNTFDDFIACSEWLIDNGWTSPEHLGIAGGSNGGLLVGAAMTQRPELYGAVVCSYPLLDMLRYHQFLVARFWVPEYGSAEDPEQYRTLRDYSPYHNVEEGVDYPATLFITGDGDTRVAPLHARKMTALVQARSKLVSPVMLRYHLKAGHAGGRAVSEEIEDTTDMLTFLAWQLGMS